MDRVDAARGLLDDFLRDTGVVGPAPPRRYLWTDAFAVCTLLGLHAEGLEPPGDRGDDYRALAVRLAGQVHRTLGRHRPDDARQGWISGLDEEEGARHPTRGGLRIGKPRPERAPDEPPDRREEWDRDGQYFHYLTRWMHALLRLARETGDPSWLGHARELARAAHGGFVHTGPGGERVLFWKMSIDLSRPLVTATGRHDPLDGYLTFRTLAAPGDPAGPDPWPGLQEEITGMATLAGLDDGADWATDDPLGLGGLLVDALRVAQLRARGVAESEGLLLRLLDAAARGLGTWGKTRQLDHPPARRLPFRELGLSLGVHAVERLAGLTDRGALPETGAAVEERLGRILDAQGMARSIEATWSDPGTRSLEVWQGHADINAVMLATSLLPDGYLAL